MAERASWSNAICFAAMVVGPLSVSQWSRVTRHLCCTAKRCLRVSAAGFIRLDHSPPCGPRFAQPQSQMTGDERLVSLCDDRQHVILAHDQQLFAVDLDFAAGVAGEDDLVPLLHAEGGPLA